MRFSLKSCLFVFNRSVCAVCLLLVLGSNWEKDKEEFSKKLYYFNAIDYPVQMLLFPEGGDFTPRTKTRSDKFADDNDLPRLLYCFHPRTTGFVYTINAMRDHSLDAVYDMTIAYPDLLPKDPVDVANGIMRGKFIITLGNTTMKTYHRMRKGWSSGSENAGSRKTRG